jgi:energy-coupling factor transport system permease protein
VYLEDYTLILIIVIANLFIYGFNLYPSFILILKFIMIIIYTSGLTFTTSSNEITYGLEKSFGFLKYIKVPVSELALTIALALRFIPTVLETANKILKSQASRGIDFKHSKINGKIRALASMLAPMFILSFKRADDLGNAMEVKLYNYSDNRTNYRMNKWNNMDTVLIVVQVIIVIGVIVSEVVL